jgi:hypothetical protein
MNRHYCAAGVAALLLLLLVGCGAQSHAALPEPQPGTVRQQQEAADGVLVTLDTAEAPKPNEYQRFLVMLTDAQGTPMEEADVYLDLRCLALCAPNTPIAEPIGGGSYVAETAYTMAGKWKVTVHATIGERDYEAVFATEVAEG